MDEGHGDSRQLQQLRQLLTASAHAFADRRPDVSSSEVVWPRRGLHIDEATSLLRAVDSGFAEVDPAGYVTLPHVRAKTPRGRYALLSRSGSGASVNLEYLLQIGAAGELALDHGWPGPDLDFERGEFDILGYDSTDTVVLAVEAKARVTGPDSLEMLLDEWIGYSAGQPVKDSNAGRKYRELLRLCATGNVILWLVAAGARWTFEPRLEKGMLSLVPLGQPPRHRGFQRREPASGRAVLWVKPFDASAPKGEPGLRGTLLLVLHRGCRPLGASPRAEWNREHLRPVR